MLLTEKRNLAPSLLTQKVSRIHGIINNYNKSSSKILGSEIRSLKDDFHAAAPWVNVSKSESEMAAEFKLLSSAMVGLDKLSRELDCEGLGEAQGRKMILAHNTLHSSIEQIKLRLLSNHEDPQSFAVVVEAAAMISQNPDYRNNTFASIYKASLRGGPEKLVFREIQRRI